MWNCRYGRPPVKSYMDIQLHGGSAPLSPVLSKGQLDNTWNISHNSTLLIINITYWNCSDHFSAQENYFFLSSILRVQKSILGRMELEKKKKKKSTASKLWNFFCHSRDFSFNGKNTGELLLPHHFASL